MKLLQVTIVAILGFIIISQYQEAKATERTAKHDYVYLTCQLSRTQVSIPEEDCATAQITHGIEYLCNERNQSINNNCRTIDNKNLEN